MALDAASERIHATAVALVLPSGPRAAVVRGPSGAGKSDLALRCLAVPPGGLIAGRTLLVADDQVKLTRADDRVVVSAPQALRGLIEVRGLGIMSVPQIGCAPLHLIVDLVGSGDVDRMPDPMPHFDVLGVAVRRLEIHAFEASAALKLLICLQDA